MAKMWTSRTTAVVSVGLAALFMVLASGQTVNFDSTHQNCSHSWTLIQQCDYMVELASNYSIATGTFTYEFYCTLLQEKIACVETAMCHCNFSADDPQLLAGYASHMNTAFHYNKISFCGDEDYGQLFGSNGSDVFGPLSINEGVNCSKYNKTARDLTIEIALANSTLVLGVEEVCSGIQPCFHQYDRDLEVALYQKDMVEYCASAKDLVQCMENASCSCGQSQHDNVTSLVNAWRIAYRYDCYYVSDDNFTQLLDPRIKCPGVDNCNSTHPLYECRNELWTVLNSSPQLNETCMAYKDYGNCTEQLACECGFHRNKYYLLNVAFYKDAYSRRKCEPITGLFPNHTGFGCLDDDRFTDAEKYFVLSLYDVGFDSAEEAVCPGLLACYNQSLAEASDAYHRKDLTDICQIQAERIACVEQTYCGCGRQNYSDVQVNIQRDRNDFDTWCYADQAVLPLTCFDCKSPTDENICLDEWTALRSARSIPDYCMKLLDAANCTENVACVCGYENELIFTHELSLAKHYYQHYECEKVGGIFPNHTGFKCGPGGVTDPAKLITFSLADSDFVKMEDETCPGIKQCYSIADVKATEAFRMKDLSAICQTESERIQCVEQKYCECGKLHEPATFNSTIRMRIEYDYLCYDVTKITPRKKCIGRATCVVTDPISICRRDFTDDYNKSAGDEYASKCKAFQEYFTCMEEVGCACGLVADGKSETAFMVYNLTTYVRKVYEDRLCNKYTGDLVVQENGIKCDDSPDDTAKMLLSLAYAESSEVAALVTKCDRVKGCFQDNDKTKAKALYARNYLELCYVQSKLVDCLDKAYCRCKLNGTADTEAYMATEITSHTTYCGSLYPISREKCVLDTSAAAIPHSPVLSLAVLLILLSLMP